MALSSLDYWDYFNQSSYTLQPPINPTSYESARQFLKTMTSRHGYTFETITHKITSKPGKLSDTSILTARISKQSTVLIWEYQQASQLGHQDLAQKLLLRCEEVMQSPMNLALVEFIAASGTSNDLIQFIIDLNAMAKQFHTSQEGMLFGEIPPERTDLLDQGYLLYLYFFGVFPGKEE